MDLSVAYTDKYLVAIIDAALSLTKRECYPPLMYNKFQITYSNEQVMWYHRMAVHHCRNDGTSS